MITYHGRHGDCQPLQYRSSCSHGPVSRFLSVKSSVELGPATGPRTGRIRPSPNRPQAGSNICEIAPVETKTLPGRQRQGGIIAALGHAQVFLGFRKIWMQT